MEYAYRADAWQALYTAVAGATAALTGLLFIALSLDLPIRAYDKLSWLKHSL